MTSPLAAIIKAYSAETNRLRDMVQNFIKDPMTASLTTRWETFLLACNANLLSTYSSQQSITSLDKHDVSWYDDFYKDRYALVEWAEIVSDIESAQETDSGDRFKFKADIDQIKEEIMADGYSGFENDW